MIIREGESVSDFERRKQECENLFWKIIDGFRKQIDNETDPLKKRKMQQLIDEAVNIHNEDS